MVLYELTIKDSYSYWKTKREAMAEAKAANSPDWLICSVDRIETPRLDSELFVDVLNGGGFVINRRNIWQNAEAKRATEVAKKMGWKPEQERER